MNSTIDVAVCTYNSERYLDACLSGIFDTIPVNKLIVVDHHSTDKTIEIAKKYGANIFFENVGLGYARQVALYNMETPILLFVDSDVVLHEKGWFERATAMLEENSKIGGIAIWTPTKYPPWRQKYTDYWWHQVPAIKKYGFSNTYLLRREAIKGIKIPRVLAAYEQAYIQSFIHRRGWSTTVIPVEGIHYYDFPRHEKGAWLGAGERIFHGIKPLPYLLLRHIVFAPLKAIPPALAYKDPKIITSNTKYWLAFLKGWLKPTQYIKMPR